MSMESFVLGSFSTNVYLLDERYLVDPGGMNPTLRERLEECRSSLQGVLLTHAHSDHFLGLDAVRSIVGDCPVYCHSEDLSLMEHPKMNLSEWQGDPRQLDSVKPLDSVELTIDGEPLEVLETPGHTPGSVSFHWAAEEVLLSGDALFRGSIGRTDLPGGDQQQLLKSIREVILSRPDETEVHPGHGPATTVGRERRTNPFLREK